MKFAVFVNKIANCRKCATVRAFTRRVWRPGFWKILKGLYCIEHYSNTQTENLSPLHLLPFSIPASPPSPHRIRSKRPPRGPFPYFCRHKKSSELWRIKETSCQRNSYPKQSQKIHPSTRISRKKHYKKYCISWSHSYV